MKLPQPCPKCKAPIMNYGMVCAACGYRPSAPLNEVDQLQQELTALRSRCEAMERALKPFAEIAEMYERSAKNYPGPPLSDSHRDSISIGDCRAALRALTSAEGR